MSMPGRRARPTISRPDVALWLDRENWNPARSCRALGPLLLNPGSLALGLYLQGARHPRPIRPLFKTSRRGGHACLPLLLPDRLLLLARRSPMIAAASPLGHPHQLRGRARSIRAPFRRQPRPLTYREFPPRRKLREVSVFLLPCWRGINPLQPTSTFPPPNLRPARIDGGGAARHRRPSAPLLSCGQRHRFRRRRRRTRSTP